MHPAAVAAASVHSTSVDIIFFVAAANAAPAGLPLRLGQWHVHGQVAFDAVELVNSGGHPVGQVLAALRDLPPGKFYALIAPFEPAPLMDKAREAGMEVHAERQAEDRYRVIFWRRSA